MSDNIVNVSIDDGHFNGKAQKTNRLGDIVSYISPSFVMPGSNTTFSVGAGNEDSAEFLTESEDGSQSSYTTLQRLRYGEKEYVVDTQNHEYQLSVENRVFVHSMLHRMGLAGKKVNLITTSPIRRYFKTDGQLNENYIKTRNENLMKPVENLQGETIEIVSVNQIPESYSAYLSLLFKYKVNKGVAKLELNPDYRNKDILLFDFGGQTLDVAVISNGQLITRKSYTEEGVGMLAVNDLIADELKSYRRNIERHEINQVIDTGVFFTNKARTNQIDVREIVNKAIMSVYSNGLDKVLKRTPTNEFDLVLGAGGPMEAIKPMISTIIPDLVTVDNPLWANSNGGLKYLISQQNK